jgi:Cu(I)/Ag(I) efflux system membrane fusion protein
MRRISQLAALVAAFGLGVAAAWWFMVRGTPTTQTAAAATAHAGTPAAAEPEVLYWYDPMYPQSRFDKPGKSPFMDMMLVPKYAGDGAQDQGTVKIEPRLLQNLGVRTGRAVLGRLDRGVRAVGAVAFDERAVSVVQARVGAIVEQLHVRAPLDPVRAGQPLFTLIAPDWTAAQEEYLALRRASAPGLDALQAAARRRLLLLGMGEAQVRAIEHSGYANPRFTIAAPRAGVVAELAVREGATVMAGMPLARINGLQTVWVNAAVPERAIGALAPGSMVKSTVAAYPGRTFSGTIEALLPEIEESTRTLVARVVLNNADGALVPGMYAQLDLQPADAGPRCVLVPSEALIMTGTRQVVIVALGKGRFRAQEVKVGIEAQGQTEIFDGVEEGEEVVLSGQFLIDSEASLSGAIGALEGLDVDSPSERVSEGAPRHEADGTIERIEGERWTIDTGPVASLQMGAMTMTFQAPVEPPAEPPAPGQRIRFSFFQNSAGDYEVETVTVLPGASQ